MQLVFRVHRELLDTKAIRAIRVHKVVRVKGVLVSIPLARLVPLEFKLGISGSILRLV